MRYFFFRIFNKIFNTEAKFLKIATANSMVGLQHFIFLNQWINKINLKNNSGSIVECGVWKGGIMMWMIYSQKKFSDKRHFYLYDTFEGMTEPDLDKDGKEMIEVFEGTKNKKITKGYDEWHTSNKWAYSPINVVKSNVNKVKYPKDKIHYIVGDVVETLNISKNIPDSISILRLDTDFYFSTKAELEVLYPKVVSGGLIIVDDYFSHQGANKATNEFINEYKISNSIQLLDKKETGGKFCFMKK